MKKFLLSVAFASVAVFASSCGMPNCDALKAQCTACTNATGKATCNTAYTTYTTVGGAAGESSCKAVIDLKTYAADGTVCK